MAARHTHPPAQFGHPDVLPSGGTPMPVLVECRDRLTGAAAVQVVDAKAIRRIHAEPQVGPGKTWLYMVVVEDWSGKPILATGALPETEAMEMVRRLHAAMAEAARS